MKILKATHLGMCFGVRDAIALAEKHASTAPLTILGELVHNESVLADLRARGVELRRNIAEVQTNTVMITAHGTSDRALARVRDGGFHIVEATCPLVHFAHRALRQLVSEGFHPVVIGRRDHVEVRGLTEDFAECDIVLCEADVDAITPRSRFGVVSQTTQPISRVRELVRHLCARFPEAEVKCVDTVCQPTKQRQSAAIELARTVDVVIVIGGANSNNTRELVATCSRHCANVHHVQGAADLRGEWFSHARTVGITAGTSTPDAAIDAVEQAIAKISTFEEAA